MIIDIALSDELTGTWRNRVQRQIDFKLASVSSSIRVLSVSLRKVADPSQEPTLICHMKVKLIDGSDEEVATTGLPNMCIADSAARLARRIARKAQRKEARWIGIARG